jgi:hypothetical protein
MSDYKCCLLDASEMIMAVDTVQCEDDVRAMVLAAHLIVRKYPQFSAVEVWGESHRVGRITNPKPPAANRAPI